MAVLFGLTGIALLGEAIDGIVKDVQYYVLADTVAGLFAAVIGTIALRRATRFTTAPMLPPPVDPGLSA